MKNFTTSNVHCPVVSYKLISDFELLTVYDLLPSPVIEEKFFTMEIPTSEVKDFDFFLLAEVLGGNWALSFPLRISITEIPASENLFSLISMAPFFTSELKSQYLDLNSPNLSFELPEIMDSDEDLSTVDIESVTLGNTYFTNSSNDISNDEYLSYDFASNVISLNIPMDSR